MPDKQQDTLATFQGNIHPQHHFITPLRKNSCNLTSAEVKGNFETLTESKELLFARGADHYLHTAQSLCWVFYDRQIVNELITGLVQELNGE